MKRKAKRFVAHFIVLLFITIITGFVVVSCVPTTEYRYKSIPISSGRYTFSGFKIPETKAPASLPFTIAIVEPYYKERLHHDYSNVIKSFSSSVGVGLDEILVAKGLTTKGPYGSLDEIPYPDKRGANLTLTETVFIFPVDQKHGDTVYDYYDDGHGNNIGCEVQNYKLSVEIWIAFEMREPLSAEKMWIKKIDLGVLEGDYQIATKKYYHNYAQTDPWAPPRGEWRYGDVLFNTKADAFASLLNKVYPKVMESAWVFLNTEEMKTLDKKGEEIRKLKVY